MQPSNHQNSLRLGAPMGAALLSGTALAMICLVGAPAFAGEIDVLKDQLQALQKKVEQIESTQTQKMTTRGKPKVQLTVSGQVNRALLYADNGDHEQLFNVDNDNSSTRVRWVAKARLNDDLSSGAQIEVQLESNSTAKIEMGQNGAIAPDGGGFSERKMEFWVDSKKMGRVWVGQGDTASNGTSEVDLAGTQVVAYSGIADMAGGICFKGPLSGACGNSLTLSPTTSVAFKAVTIGSVWSNLDGLSRNDRIRYDTPTIAGFKASASYVEADTWDIALRYGANYEAIGTKVSAAISYQDPSGRTGSSKASKGLKGSGEDHQLNGSISALHSSGFSLTYAMGRRSLGEGADDLKFHYVKGGWQMDVPSPNLGRFAISVDYGKSDNNLQAVKLIFTDKTAFTSGPSTISDSTTLTTFDVDTDLTTWGIAVTQKVAKLGAEFYLAYRHHDLDVDPEEFGFADTTFTVDDIDDINTFMLGARIQF